VMVSVGDGLTFTVKVVVIPMVQIPIGLFKATFTAGIGAVVTNYYPLNGYLLDSTESRVQCHLQAGTFRRLKVHLAYISTDAAVDVILRRNGADTILACVSMASANDYEDTGDVSVAETDHLDFMVVLDNLTGVGTGSFFATITAWFEPS